jgi:hypothetical protein
MAHKKKHGPAPVPPGNQPKAGPPDQATEGSEAKAGGGSPFEDQDAKRRLGGFESAGEHARQQPGPLNDAQRRSC